MEHLTEMLENVNTNVDLLNERIDNITTTQRNVQQNVQQIRNNGGEMNDVKNTYSGYSAEDGRSWLEKYEAKGQIHGWNDQRKAQGFRLGLTGPAEVWYQELPQATKGDYTALRQAFRDKFITQQNRWVLEGILQRRKQGSNETVEAYSADMRRYFFQLEKGPVERLTLYVNGLRDGIKVFVMGQNPDNLEDAEKAARLGETVAEMTTSQQGRASNSDTSTALAALVNKVDLLSRKVNGMGNHSRTTNGKPKSTTCGRIGHVTQSCRKHIQCYNCKGYGHMARN